MCFSLCWLYVSGFRPPRTTESWVQETSRRTCGRAIPLEQGGLGVEGKSQGPRFMGGLHTQALPGPPKVAKIMAVESAKGPHSLYLTLFAGIWGRVVIRGVLQGLLSAGIRNFGPRFPMLGGMLKCNANIGDGLQDDS